MLQHWQFPKGQLKSQYQSLPAASRFKLLQAAAAHVLQNQVLPLLEQEATKGENAVLEFSHNRFAGENIQIAKSKILGLSNLYSEPSLMPRLLEEGQFDHWSQGIAELQRILNQNKETQDLDFNPAISQLLNVLEPDLAH